MNEQHIFLEALALPPDARSVYLEQACADDPALKAAVAGLLRAHRGGTDFLESPASDVEPTAAPATNGVHPGDRIGPYKLIELIGEGGMGSVYLAQQTEPVKRAVAIKVIKAGMDSKAVLARFEAERQALAIMDHPNIAKVLDAGATTAGRPYFVMELVKGLPITKFCDERRYTLRQRLELFVHVCQAIQHAHQKGVIHRDLKPSNVLVALYDDRPVPKVIDFGVAKATGQSLTDLSVMTHFGAVVGTVEYMSPEQASLNNLDVDTRSDVYSLGVLLYELLTGSTPMDKKSLGKAALMEILRIVREVEAPAPSVKLSTADTLPSVAANRSVEPAKLSKLMKGELDWVLLKALEKDRTRRYETANALARDLQRYLSNEMVEARPPSARYRAAKFVRRYSKHVVAASLIVLALIGGVVGTTWAMLDAQASRKRESERAEGEKKANEQSQKRLVQIEKGIALFASIVKDLNPNNEKAGGPPIYEQLLERAEAAADGLDAETVGDPLTLARLQLDLGRTIQHLGNPKKAAALLVKAHATLAREHGPDGAESLAAAHALALAWIDCGGSKVDDAICFLTRLRNDRAAKLGPEHHDTLDAANSLALALNASGQARQALELYQSIREPLIRRLGTDHDLTLQSLGNMAKLYAHSGRVEDSIRLFEQVRGLQAKKWGSKSVNALTTGAELAQAHETNGDLDAAIRVYEEVVDALRTRAPHHMNALIATNNLGSAYLSAGRLDKSIPLLEELLRRAEARSGRKDYQTLLAMINLGGNYLAADRVVDATKLLEEAYSAARDHELRRRAGGGLAQAYAESDRKRDARKLIDSLAYESRRDFAEGDPKRAHWLSRLGATMMSLRAPFEAEPLLREAYAIRANKEAGAWTTFSTQALLGSALFRMGNIEEAEPMLQMGFAGMKARLPRIPPRDRQRLFETAATLAHLYAAAQKPELAAKWDKEADALKVAQQSFHSGRALSVSDGSSRAQTPSADPQGSPNNSRGFLALVRPLLALVGERPTKPQPAAGLLAATVVVLQETTIMQGFRLIGMLALACAATEGSNAKAQYAFSLIDVPGSTFANAIKVNNAGDIVGIHNNGPPGPFSYLMSGGTITSFTVRGSAVTNAWGINDQQTIVGKWDDPLGVVRGFLLHSATYTNIEVPGATLTIARGINNGGDIVGMYADSTNVSHGFLLVGGVFTTLDVPGATKTGCNAINNAGIIVGEYTDSQGVVHGFRLSQGAYASIDFPGGLKSNAYGINNLGTVVGKYTGADGKECGFLLSDGAYSTIDVPGATYISANGINDFGEVVGRADINGVVHGFKTITPKYLTVDDVSSTGGDALYQYDATGLAAVPQPLYMANVSTRGLTRNAAGTNYWALNANKTVVVYDANFQEVDFWTAWGLPSNAQPEGITTSGDDVWILDNKSRKVYMYAGAAIVSDAEHTASSSFSVKSTNSKDIVTNGTYIWVVEDGATDKVYKYTMNGTFVSTFNLATPGATSPVAMSIDPANPNDIWIVDGGTKRVYRYANAVNAPANSNQTAVASFPLSSGNTNPQGLAIKP